MPGERVGIYLRLSRDDGAEALESMSIANQRELLLGYAAQRGWTVAEVYTDDGYTGTNFRRPGFQLLLADIDRGRVNTVLTKDLSRLGRDQIGTMYYLQVYFPGKKVRYIAVNEGIDTTMGGGSGIVAPFLAAANDFYAADISRKVRGALEIRRKSGLFIGAAPPLGYQKDPLERGRLRPDPGTDWIVQMIFQRFLTSGSVRGVARELTQQGVPTPSACKSAGGAGAAGWSDTMVRRILTNPTYAGHLTQNRRRKVSYKLNVYESLPPAEWVVVPNTHAPLVSQAVFDQAQSRLGLRSYTPKNGKPHPLTGMAFCGDCGAPMAYQRDRGRVYMVCRRYRREGRASGCTAHLIREEEVTERLCRLLRRLAQGVAVEALEPPESPDRRRETAEGTLLERLEGCGRMREALYRDRTAGLLAEEEFWELFTKSRREREQLEEQIKALRQTTGKAEGGEWRDRAEELLRFGVLERRTAAALIERVTVGRNRELVVALRFSRPEWMA